MFLGASNPKYTPIYKNSTQKQSHYFIKYKNRRRLCAQIH